MLAVMRTAGTASVVDVVMYLDRVKGERTGRRFWARTETTKWPFTGLEIWCV